ncbi:MAG: ABC transporter permease [Spirochaetales bacterium]|nr:ABC transporter permease [Spirochaetales bacterium]
MREKNTLVSRQYRKRSRAGEVWHRLKKNKGAMIGLGIIVLLALIAILADVLVDYDTQVIGMTLKDRLQHPSKAHIMGTDDLGRDIFARLLYGSRFSLSVGVVAVAIAVVVGVILGAFAGYYTGGIVEDIIMRATDIFAAVPNMLMAIVIVAALGANTLNLMISVGVTSIPQFVRTTRAAVLTVTGQEYIESARAIGESETKIIFKHILPNCLSPIIVRVTLRVSSAIISASSLSFLGLGVPAPAPEWGSMLSSGRAYLRGYSYMTLFPGLAIMITVLAFNMVGDGLRDAMDPKLKK